MAGWFLIGFGILLIFFAKLPAYQNWMKQRLEKKGFTQVDILVYRRIRTITMLSFIYLMAGLVLMISRL
ncbi:MAG TPA: hypothetical protein VJ824_00655 [Bacillota bacterium]|nr:hypothetical protein [Bacillota bacterium]